ncbi:MAG: Hsp20/alpha crystallin family protein [Proteobacteria bacterium]|nr:Hsp20/alpha crystallin family protein [Pseudomonadota bacterium]
MTTKTETKKSKKSSERNVPITNDWGWSVDNLHHQFDRLYDQMFKAHEMFGTPLPRWKDINPARGDAAAFTGPSVLPQTDICETDEQFTMTLDLPGMTEDEVDLKIKDGRLTVSGEKSTEREEEEKDYHLRERRFGSFSRSFRIPESVDDTKIKAEFSQGVLSVTLPKKPTAASTARKIKVKPA